MQFSRIFGYKLNIYTLNFSIPQVFYYSSHPTWGGGGVVDLRHTKAGCVQSQPENFVLQNCMEIWE